jgi:hypothetical protein
MNYMFDHNPILLVFGSNNDFREDSHNKGSIKRFENIWIKEQACTQIIKETWDQIIGDTSDKLRAVMDNVFKWGKANWATFLEKLRPFKPSFRV